MGMHIHEEFRGDVGFLTVSRSLTTGQDEAPFQDYIPGEKLW